MASRFWTTRELAALRQHYPTGGPRAVWLALPDDAKRSFDAIHCAAKVHGVTCLVLDARYSVTRTPELDKAIRALTPMGQISRRFGVSREWLKARASQLKVAYTTRVPRRWTPTEDGILLASEGKATKSVRYQLAKAGFHRGATAIVQRRSKLKVSGRTEFPNYFTLYELADLLGRQPDTVKRWLTLRTDPLAARREGQMYLLKHIDVRLWIIRNPERLDLARLPASHYQWFIEFLTGKSPIDARDSTP